jgi:glycosyltransferase involved in cell wall biosynthesis
MKTILLTLNYWQGGGGVERVVVNMANALVKRNYRVIILSLFPDRITTTEYVLNPWVEKHYLSAVDTRDFSFAKAVLSKVRLFFALRKFIKRQGISFVIKNESFIPPLFFRVNGTITCTFFHSCYNYYSFSLRKQINLWGANYNIVLTSKELDKWKHILHHIVVIPNMFIPMREIHGIRREKKIVAVGHLNENKAFERLIRSYLPLAHEMPEWKLVIIGTGNQQPKLQSLIDSGAAQQQIEIMPPTNHIEEQYASAAICAMSSYLEGFPMVLVEAMSFGVPCVSFDITTGPSDIIQHGKTGLLVPDGDETAMKRALESLMSDENLQMKMGEEARLSISRFSEGIVMQQWISLIERDL